MMYECLGQPVIYLKRCSVSHCLSLSCFWGPSLELLKYFFSSLSCSSWNRAQHCSFTNDSHCQTDSISEHRKKASFFLKPLSILFSLSCSTAPQYSLKSFRGTSEAFVKCICIRHVISWKTASLFSCFVFISKIIHICTCSGIQTYVNVICSQH